jgi:hypothetical protein
MLKNYISLIRFVLKWFRDTDGHTQSYIAYVKKNYFFIKSDLTFLGNWTPPNSVVSHRLENQQSIDQRQEIWKLLRYHQVLLVLMTTKIIICTTSYESHTFFHEFADWLTRGVARVNQANGWKRDFHNVLYTLFFCISKKLEKFRFCV